MHGLRPDIVDVAAVAMAAENAAVVNLFISNIRETPNKQWLDVGLTLNDVRFLFNQMFCQPFWQCIYYIVTGHSHHIGDYDDILAGAYGEYPVREFLELLMYLDQLSFESMMRQEFIPNVPSQYITHTVIKIQQGDHSHGI